MYPSEAAEPPEGFEVVRESDINPASGRATHWVYRGSIGERRLVRPGYGSREQACRAAWDAYLMALSTDEERERRLARQRLRELRRRETWLDKSGLRTLYTVRLGTWEEMQAQLLCQIIDDAGSIRRAAITMGIARSTLAAWVRKHRQQGTWPA